LPAYFYATNGSISNTTVQFVAAGATANLGVNYPNDYWSNVIQPDPFILIPNYTNGTYDGPGKAVGAILGIANNQGALTTAAMTPTVSTIAKQEQVGAVWGNARDKVKDRFFFSTLLKRHVGFGPQGVGGIYIIDKTSGSYDFAGSFTLQGVTPSNGGSAIDLGSVTRVTSPSSADNYLASGTNLGEPNRDLDAFAKVGKVAYGDIDIDDATNTLYAINLNQRTIITVDISGGTASLNNASAATLAPLTKSYNIVGATGIPTCSSGELRPWALKIYKGRGYLGVVCDASTSQAVGDFKAYVLSFDINNIAAGFATELIINNYTNYKAWANTWTHTGFATSATSTALSWRQMILSDIEFDEDNNMIISSLNRFGMQMGYFNYIPVAGNTSLVQVKAYADILKACYDPTLKTWSMGAVSCPVPAGGSTSEFFNMDWAGDGTDESSNGALAKLMGSQRIVNVASDPFPFTTSTNVADYYTTGGLNWFSTADGSKTATARLFKTDANAVSYGKAIGLGDIEFNLMPQPIEIGNRVFMDTNEDGIQDANEMGIDGVTVSLYQVGNPTPTTAVTANGGQYIFNNLLPNTAYEIKILAANIPSGKQLTQKDATSTGAADVADSDANLVGADAVITYTTGSAGQNNHTLDFGFKAACVKPSAITLTSTAPTCVNGIAQNNGKITLTAVTGADKYFINSGISSTGTYSSAITIPANGTDIQTSIPNAGATYTVRFYNGVEDCYQDEIVSIQAVLCPSACSVDVTSTTPGSCYDNGAGQLIYDLSVMVSWSGAPSGESINVTSDAGGTASIDPATQTSPVFVTLTGLPGDGATTIVTAAFIATSTCLDNFTFTAPTCVAALKGSISGKIWKDTNDDGIENNGEAVVGNVKVELYNADASGQVIGAALQTITISNTGLYTFSNLPQGDYVVKIDQTSIMSNMQLSPKKDFGNDDVIDNDFDFTSALTGKITVNPSIATSKDIVNVNAAIRNLPVLCPSPNCGEGISLRKL
jgi:SdrD B-like domain